MMRIARFTSLAAAMLLAVLEVGAFAPPFASIRRPIPSCVSSRPTRLFSSSALEDEVKSMRIGELKSELESYGISTRSFLEKSELVSAVLQARKEGKTPVATASSSAAATSPTVTAESTPAPSPTPVNAADRQARLEAEMEACKAMKVGDLKAELEGLGVSTKSFFEKSEFVRTLAEARVDGIKKSKKKKRRAAEDDVEEVTAAKVEVITNDSVGPKTKKTRDANAGPTNPFGGGGNPFGGAAGGNPFGGAAGGNPFGGMGGGSIEDMLKGMGMGGMGGGNPFGGAAGAAGGGNPFGGMGGNPMEAAQKAMSNPKVQAVMAKAQKNPKVMKAVQESMGNPANMMKYMSDPEVGPILKELQEAMMG